jgi:hypothetical protein
MPRRGRARAAEIRAARNEWDEAEKEAAVARNDSYFADRRAERAQADWETWYREHDPNTTSPEENREGVDLMITADAARADARMKEKELERAEQRADKARERYNKAVCN